MAAARTGASGGDGDVAARGMAVELMAESTLDPQLVWWFERDQNDVAGATSFWSRLHEPVWFEAAFLQ